MENSKLGLFEKFILQNPIELIGGYENAGQHGIVEGSSYYQGQSYVDVRWDNGVTTCDLPIGGSIGASDSGSDSAISQGINIV